MHNVVIKGYVILTFCALDEDVMKLWETVMTAANFKLAKQEENAYIRRKTRKHTSHYHKHNTPLGYITYHSQQEKIKPTNFTKKDNILSDQLVQKK